MKLLHTIYSKWFFFKKNLLFRDILAHHIFDTSKISIKININLIKYILNNWQTILHIKKKAGW